MSAIFIQGEIEKSPVVQAKIYDTKNYVRIKILNNHQKSSKERRTFEESGRQKYLVILYLSARQYFSRKYLSLLEK